MPGITINSKLDTRPVKSSLTELNQYIQSLRGTVAKTGRDMDASVVGYAKAMSTNAKVSREVNTQVEKLDATYRDLLQQVEDVANTKIDTKEYADLKKEIESTEKQLVKLKETQARLKDLGKDAVPTQAYASTLKNIEKVRTEGAKIQSQYIKMLPDNDAAIKKYNDIQKKLTVATQKRDKYEKEMWTSPGDAGMFKVLYDEAAKEVDKYTEELKQASVAVEHYDSVLGKLEERINALKEEYHNLFDIQINLEKTGSDVLETDAMRRNQYDIQKVTERLQKLQQQKEDMESKGDATVTGDTTREYGDLIVKADQAEEKLRDVREKAQESAEPIHLKEWEQMTTVTGAVAEGFAKLKNSAALAQQAIKNPLEALDRIVPVVASGIANLAGRVYNLAVSFGKMAINRVVSSLQHMASSAIHAATGFAKMAASTVVSFIQRLAVSARNAAVNLTRMAGAGVISGLRKIGSFALKAGSALLNMGKSAKRSNGGLKQSLTMILRYTLGIRSLFMLVRRLRSAVVDAFKNMANKIPEVNKTISSMASSLDMVKNSLATAFQPILTAIAPYLVQLMDMLAGAMTKIGEFFAALTGQNYVYQATKAQIDYAKSLDKTRKKAKETENQLAGFDHLNILKDNKSDSDSDDNKTPTSDFKKVPIESWIKNLADRIKELIKSGDFFGIGELFADELMRIAEKINWAKIGRTIAYGINAAVDVVNGFFDTFDFIDLGEKFSEAFMNAIERIHWYELGRAMTQKVRALIELVWGFISDIDWDLVGDSIGNFLQGAFDNIPWEMLGELIGTGITKVFIALLTAIEAFDWDNAGKRLSDGFYLLVHSVNIDVIYSTLSAALKGVIDLILPILTDHETWNKIASDFGRFLNNLFQDETLWTRLGNALIGGITTAIDALKTFVSEFKWGESGKAFHDRIFLLIEEFPLNELGGALMELLTGALKFMNEVFGDETLFYEIGTKLADFLNRIFGKDEFWSEAGTLANNAMKSILAFGNGVLDDFEAGKAADNIKLALGKIQWGEIATDTWELIKKFFKKAGSFLNVLFADESELHWDPWEKMYVPDPGTSLGTRIGNKIRGALDGIEWDTIADALWTKAQEAFHGVEDFLSALFAVGDDDMKEGESRLQAIARKIGEKLAEIDWKGALNIAFTKIGEVLKGLIDGLLGDESGNGKVLLWIAGGFVALKAGIIPLIGKLIAGLASGLVAGGPALEAALIAMLSGVIVTGTIHIVKSIHEMLTNAEEVFETHKSEMEMVMDMYIKQYQDAGAESANAMINSMYQIELEGNNLRDNLETIGREIANQQKETFQSITSDTELALAAYRKIFDEEGTEAANEWAKNNLKIVLSSEDMQTNLETIANVLEGYAADGTTNVSQMVSNACDGVFDKIKKSSSEIETNVEKSVKATESTTGAKAGAIKNNLTTPYQQAATDINSLTNQIRTAVDSSTGNMVSDVEANMNEASRSFDSSMKEISRAADSGMRDAERSVSGSMSGMERSVSSTTDNMTSKSATGTDSQAKEYIDKYYEIAYIVDTSMSDASNYMERHTSCMEDTARNGMNDMVYTVQDGTNDMVRAFEYQDWYSIGSDIISGIAQGIYNGWGWLQDTVWDLANSLFQAARAALGIASPSKVFRDEVGYMVGAGLAEGLDDSQHEVLGSITGMAKAMVAEMQDTELTPALNGAKALDGLDGVLDGFAYRVENSFATMTERLQAIADNVVFRTPDIAAGTVLPYSIQGRADYTADDVTMTLDENNERLISTMIQLGNNMTSAIIGGLERYCQTHVNIDRKSLTDAIVDEINRRARASGGTPILV